MHIESRILPQTKVMLANVMAIGISGYCAEWSCVNLFLALKPIQIVG